MPFFTKNRFFFQTHDIFAELLQNDTGFVTNKRNKITKRGILEYRVPLFNLNSIFMFSVVFRFLFLRKKYIFAPYF